MKRMEILKGWWRREFVLSGLFALLAIALLVRSLVHGFYLGGMLILVIATLGIALLIREGMLRWRSGEAVTAAWAASQVRRRVGSRAQENVLVRFQGCDPGDTFTVDFVVQGPHLKAIVVIGLVEKWSRCSIDADETQAVLVSCRDAFDADKVLLWLPLASPTDWRTRIWPHLRGVQVIMGGAGKLDKPLRKIKPLSTEHGKKKSIGVRLIEKLLGVRF